MRMVVFTFQNTTYKFDYYRSVFYMVLDECLLRNFLTTCGIPYTKGDTLTDICVSRDTLVNSCQYEKIRSLVPELKKYLSSSSLTSLHRGAVDKQRWPVINILRQVLKVHGYALLPKRVSDGKTSQGTKRYRRYFVIVPIT